MADGNFEYCRAKQSPEKRTQYNPHRNNENFNMILFQFLHYPIVHSYAYAHREHQYIQNDLRILGNHRDKCILNVQIAVGNP